MILFTKNTPALPLLNWPILALPFDTIEVRLVNLGINTFLVLISRAFLSSSLHTGHSTYYLLLREYLRDGTMELFRVLISHNVTCAMRSLCEPTNDLSSQDFLVAQWLEHPTSVWRSVSSIPILSQKFFLCSSLITYHSIYSYKFKIAPFLLEPILGLQLRDSATMLVVNTMNNVLKNFHKSGV